jgi:hypothetical protein
MKSVSFIPQVIKDLEKAQEKQLDECAKHMKKKTIKKIKSKFKKRTGDLIKGVKTGRRGKDVDSSYRIVGFGPPAHQAHLLEFGTAPRTVKNYQGRKGVAVQVGQVKATHFFREVFEEEVQPIENILSKQWV